MAGRRKGGWDEQRAKFVTLRVYKRTWWRTLLAYPGPTALALTRLRAYRDEQQAPRRRRMVLDDAEILKMSALIRRGAPYNAEAFEQLLASAVEAAIVIDVEMEIAFQLLGILDAIAIGHPPAGLETLIDPDHDDLHSTIDKARRAAIGYRVLHDALTQANMGLVYQSATKWRTSVACDADDNLSEGVFGLMKAVHRYEPERGFRFSTMATSWIRSALQRAQNNHGRHIRVPVHVLEAQFFAARTTDKFLVAHGRVPTIDELNALASKHTQVRPADLHRFAAVEAMKITSLDAPRGEDASYTLHDALPDTAPSPEDALRLRELESLVNAVPFRDRRERDAFRAMMDLSEETQTEVAQRYGITKEGIRQIALKGWRKLRRSIADRGFTRASAPAPTQRRGERGGMRMVDSLVSIVLTPPRPPRPSPLKTPNPSRLPVLRARSEDAVTACYECEKPVPAAAYKLGWYRKRIVFQEHSVDYERTVQICPSCAIEYDYCSAASIEKQQRYWRVRDAEHTKAVSAHAESAITQEMIDALLAERAPVLRCDMCGAVRPGRRGQMRGLGWRTQRPRTGGLRRVLDLCPRCATQQVASSSSRMTPRT